MRKSWLWDNAVTLATLVMAVTAIVALVYAHLQIVESRRAERETNANELWRETLRLGFENAKLSDPTLKLADFDYEKLTIDGSRDSSRPPAAKARTRLWPLPERVARSRSSRAWDEICSVNGRSTV